MGKKEPYMPTVFDVANYFIVMTKYDCKDGMNDDLMTHLKPPRREAPASRPFQGKRFLVARPGETSPA
jgi:hypothetical protein